MVCLLLTTTSCGTTQFDQTSQSTISPTSLVTPTASNSSIVIQESITPITQPTSLQSNTPAPAKSPVTNTVALKKYSHASTSFSIQYPADGRIVEDSKTSTSSSFVVSNIPDSKEMPGTAKWLELQKKLPADAYSIEVFIGERSDESKLNGPDDQEEVSQSNSLGIATLPKPKMVAMPWNTCGGSVYPVKQHVIDGIEGFSGSLPLSGEGFYSTGYCFRKNKTGDDVHYQQILIRITEKNASQKLNKLLFPTIHFK